MTDRPLLMIPGPIEVSDAVVEASSGRPPGHLAGPIIEVSVGMGEEILILAFVVIVIGVVSHAVAVGIRGFVGIGGERIGVVADAVVNPVALSPTPSLPTT